jgi:hypothetical protein
MSGKTAQAFKILPSDFRNEFFLTFQTNLPIGELMESSHVANPYSLAALRCVADLSFSAGRWHPGTTRQPNDGERSLLAYLQRENRFNTARRDYNHLPGEDRTQPGRN